jgi:hypothetical protein
MASTAVDLESLKAEVIRQLELHAQRPTELLEILGNQYPDDAIKEVVLRLLQERRIEFTHDRQLLVQHQPA